MKIQQAVKDETKRLALGVTVLTVLMLGVYLILGRMSVNVVLGGAWGSVVAVLNFFFMAVGACQASDVASGQDVKRGKLIVKTSYGVRLAVIFVILFALVKSGVCDPLPSILPLAFIQPIVFVTNFFRK